MSQEVVEVPLTFHQILQQLEDPEFARSFLLQLLQEGTLGNSGLKSFEDVMALPEADLTYIAIHLFPTYFLKECDAINDLKH